jgi:hypothetical protein
MREPVRSEAAALGRSPEDEQSVDDRSPRTAGPIDNTSSRIMRAIGGTCRRRQARAADTRCISQIFSASRRSSSGKTRNQPHSASVSSVLIKRVCAPILAYGKSFSFSRWLQCSDPRHTSAASGRNTLARSRARPRRIGASDCVSGRGARGSTASGRSRTKPSGPLADRRHRLAPSHGRPVRCHVTVPEVRMIISDTACLPLPDNPLAPWARRNHPSPHRPFRSAHHQVTG